jgi:hypothetical protein
MRKLIQGREKRRSVNLERYGKPEENYTNPNWARNLVYA